MLPQKILKFRVWEMPSPGFSAGYFQLTLRQKCCRKLFILTISLVFSVSYSVTKIKIKNTKTTETGCDNVLISACNAQECHYTNMHERIIGMYKYVVI